MSPKIKIFSIITLLFALSLSFVPAAAAFDGREGSEIIIPKDETVEDDLYIAAEKIIINGTIQGDLTAAAKTIIINGAVEGDLLAAAESVVINGTVKDDARVFAAAVQLAPNAQIGDDLLFSGASLETKSQSLVSGDLLAGASQALVAGDTGGNLYVAVSAFELFGRVKGDVSAYVAPSEENEPMPPMFFGPTMEINIPSVRTGITLGKNAKIEGNFRYTAAKKISFPQESVDGEISRIETYAGFDKPQSAQEKFEAWAWSVLRTIFSLLLVGLLLGWLFPNFMAAEEYALRTASAGIFGWGIVAYALFFFALLVVVTGTVVGAAFFGFLSLGGLSAFVFFLGSLLLFALVLGFVFVAVYLSKIIVGRWGGNLILARIKPEWVNHKVYPLLVGVVLLALLTSIPSLGWLVKLTVLLFALGALWVLGNQAFRKKESPRSID